MKTKKQPVQIQRSNSNIRSKVKLFEAEDLEQQSPLVRSQSLSKRRKQSQDRVRVRRRCRQEQKRYSLTDFDAINRGSLPRVHSEAQEEPDHDDDMRVCHYCNQSFHRNKLYCHMDKCDNRK